MGSFSRNQFYMTLPSNSSLDYYAGNTANNLVTHLPTNVNLSGSWEVALVEAHYPCSLQMISEDVTIKLTVKKGEGVNTKLIVFSFSSERLRMVTLVVYRTC